jgi:hypothetical protein
MRRNSNSRADTPSQTKLSTASLFSEADRTLPAGRGAPRVSGVSSSTEVASLFSEAHNLLPGGPGN